MNFYEDIIREQRHDRDISSELVDSFLIYYAAMKNGVNRHEETDFKKLTEEAGINYDMAASITEQIQNKLNRL